MSGKFLDDSGLSYFWGKIKAALLGKQDALISGTNIKTINNQSLLGSGDITISGGISGVESGTISLSYTGGGGQLEAGTGIWRVGNMVNIRVSYASTSAMQWNHEQLAQIPDSRFWPDSMVKICAFCSVWGSGSGATWPAYIYINTDGSITAWARPATNVIFFNASYIVDVANAQQLSYANGESF